MRCPAAVPDTWGLSQVGPVASGRATGVESGGGQRGARRWAVRLLRGGVWVDLRAEEVTDRYWSGAWGSRVHGAVWRGLSGDVYSWPLEGVTRRLGGRTGSGKILPSQGRRRADVECEKVVVVLGWRTRKKVFLLKKGKSYLTNVRYLRIPSERANCRQMRRTNLKAESVATSYPKNHPLKLEPTRTGDSLSASISADQFSLSHTPYSSLSPAHIFLDQIPASSGGKP